MLKESFVNSERIDFLWMMALFCINVLLKSMYLGEYNIDLDEPFSLYHAQGSLRDLAKIFAWENNPPLFFIILHFWVGWFGIGAVSARFLPMIFSSMAVIFVYKTANKFINRTSAVFSSLLFTFSNIVIMEAHDARVYSLLVLLTAATMYYYFSFVSGQQQRKRYFIGLTLTNILLVYSHFLAFFVILSQLLFSIFFKEIRKTYLKKFLLSCIIVCIFYGPYLYFLLIRIFASLNSGIYTPKAEVVHLLNLSWIFGNNLLISIQFVFIIGIFLLFSYIKRVQFTYIEKMMIIWPFLVFLVVALVSFKLSIISIPKYLLFIVPGFFICLSLAVKPLINYSKYLGLGLIAFCTSLMVVTLNAHASQGFEISKTVAEIEKNKSDSTIVLIIPGHIDIVFTYHYNIEAFKDFGKYRDHLNKDRIYVLEKPEDINQVAFDNTADVILLVGWHPLDVYDPEGVIISTMNDQFNLHDLQEDYFGYVIYYFSVKENLQPIDLDSH